MMKRNQQCQKKKHKCAGNLVDISALTGLNHTGLFRVLPIAIC